MKKLVLMVLLGLGVLRPTMAAGEGHKLYSDPCEVSLFELRIGNAEYNEDRYQNCRHRNRPTDLILRAEQFERDMAEYEIELKEGIEERMSLEKEEKSNKIIRRFNENGMKTFRGNKTKSFLVHKFEKFEDGEKKEYEVSPKSACKYLGFEKNIGDFEVSDLGIQYDREFKSFPDAAFVEETLFSWEDPVYLDIKGIDKDFGANYSYFTKLTCERKRKQNERQQPSYVYEEEIRAIVEAQISAPYLDHDVAQILSLKRDNSDVISAAKKAAGVTEGDRRRGRQYNDRFDYDPLQR
jgi:hypothetical protein